MLFIRCHIFKYTDIAIVGLFYHMICMMSVFSANLNFLSYLSALSMLGLILIALGTGGIKPCVAAFGGDQFEDHQARGLLYTHTYTCI